MVNFLGSSSGGGGNGRKEYIKVSQLGETRILEKINMIS